MVGWTKRQTNKSRPVRCCSGLLWRKRSWTKKQSSQFTCPSTFQTSLMLTEYVYRLQEQDPGYKQLRKMASVIWESWVESLLLCIKTNQLRQFGRLMWTLKNDTWAPSFEESQGRPCTFWRNYISSMVWECLWIPQEELKSVAGWEKSCFPSWTCHLWDPRKWRLGSQWMDKFLQSFMMTHEDHYIPGIWSL